MTSTHRSVAIAVLLLASVAPAAQSPEVTFKVEVNYVEVDARVLDAEGRFVGNLTRDDFQIFEDRTPQTVAAFTRVDVPIERPTGTAWWI